MALRCGWDPTSLAYKPARVRENAASERKSHLAELDTHPLETFPTNTSSTTRTSKTTNSIVSNNNSNDSSLWPSASKCSVRTRHLSANTVKLVSRMVADEEDLYQLATSLNSAQIVEMGQRFGPALTALRNANNNLAECLKKPTSTTF